MAPLYLLVLITVPLLAIWALNTLFPVLSISYSFNTWFAALVVIGLLRAKSSS
jgi:hypothetical protein